jgi:Spy/CpxP family protein refolding chaperone
MRKLKTFTLITAALFMISTMGFAQVQRRMPRGKRMDRRADRGILFVLKAHQKELNVTDDQLKKIEELSLAFREKTVKMQNEHKLLQLELEKLLLDKEAKDYAKIEKALSNISVAKNEMIVERMKHQEEIHSVLTPEQLEALRSQMGRRFADRGFRRGRGQSRQFPRMRRQIIRK